MPARGPANEKSYSGVRPLLVGNWLASEDVGWCGRRSMTLTRRRFRMLQSIQWGDDEGE